MFSAHRIAFALVWIVASAFALFLGTQVSIFCLDPDSIAHLSVARNLMAGHGISTSILSYPLHYGFGTFPAPQTIWPPGAALLAAVLGMLGIDPVYSLIASSIAAVSLTAPVVYLTARTVGVRPWLALAAALAWLFVPASWHFAIRGMTEGPFALFVALSIYMLARASLDEKTNSQWLAAGCFAALCFLWRYQGILLLPALTVGVLVASFSQSFSCLVLRTSLVLGPPTVVIGVVFVRNSILTNVISGGQFSNVVDPLPLLLALKKLFWTVENQFNNLFMTDIVDLSRVLMFVAVILITWGMIECFIQAYFRKSKNPMALAAAATASIAMGFTIFLLGFSLWAAVTKASFFITGSSGGRYFIVLLPNILLVSAIAFEYLLKRLSVYQSVRYAPLAALAAVGFIGLTNFKLLQNGLLTTQFSRDAKHVAEVLDSPSRDAILLRDHILGGNDAQCPILSSFPSELYLFTGRNTIGLTSFGITNVIWDATLTLALIDKLGGCLVLVINKEIDEHLRSRNQVFLRDIAHGGSHPRLALVAEVPGAKLFRVLPPAQTISTLDTVGSYN